MTYEVYFNTIKVTPAVLFNKFYSKKMASQILKF